MRKFIEKIDFTIEKKYNWHVAERKQRILNMEDMNKGQDAGEDMERKTGNRRYCRKCLTRDMDQKEYFQSLREYIENLDIDIKASESLYEERLAVCKECELLMEGMCRSCGCYVELRAVVQKNYCPWKKW